jgi:hypothetical protein
MDNRWKKSSFSAGVNNCVELAWRKSTQSEGVNNCVELAQFGAEFLVRDSKNTAGPVLTAGSAFLEAIKTDRLVPRPA